MKILQNAVKITERPDAESIYLISTHRHDYRRHTFADGGFVFIDGGLDYRRWGRSSLSDDLDIQDWSIDEGQPFSLVRERLLWGTCGKLGKDRLKYSPLSTCSAEHLQAILKSGLVITPLYRRVINALLHKNLCLNS